MPTMKLGLTNHWVFLIIYAVALMIFVFRLPKEKRDWLFADPKDTLSGPKKFVLRIGQFIMVIVIVLLSLTPILVQPNVIVFIGWILYGVGTLLVLISVQFFGRAPADRPALDGPYRFSRNPQGVGLFTVLLGLAFSSLSWVIVGMVILVGFIYHIQILGEEVACRAKYGVTYEQYLQTVPRYLFFP
jgi:protein-S-isoprenylcysteine O-methyltransferase Ste14